MIIYSFAAGVYKQSRDPKSMNKSKIINGSVQEMFCVHIHDFGNLFVLTVVMYMVNIVIIVNMVKVPVIILKYQMPLSAFAIL